MMGLENIMLSDRSQMRRLHIVQLHLFQVSGTGKPIESESHVGVEVRSLGGDRWVGK